jgi:hypothetical protein
VWSIFEEPTDGDGWRRSRGILSVGSLLTLARATHGWLRRRLAALAVPLPQGAPAALRQPAHAHPAAFSSDNPSVGRARLAVLTDADNAQASLIGQVLAEVATFGTAHVKRAYGDWTGTSLKSWKEQLLAQSIQPIQQFAYVAGKNAPRRPGCPGRRRRRARPADTRTRATASVSGAPRPERRTRPGHTAASSPAR